MRDELVWSRWDGDGMEHLRLSVGENGAIADGVVVGVAGGKPFRTFYEVRCEAGWRLREIRVSGTATGVPDLELLSNGRGEWTSNGEPSPELKGCMDVDIAITPFTNTLPIRRLGLAPGESSDISVAYVEVSEEVGEPKAWAEPQRYSYLEPLPNGGIYRFESLDGGFTADLPVDADGLVIDYPGLFRRVFPNSGEARSMNASG